MRPFDPAHREGGSAIEEPTRRARPCPAGTARRPDELSCTAADVSSWDPIAQRVQLRVQRLTWVTEVAPFIDGDEHLRACGCHANGGAPV